MCTEIMGLSESFSYGEKSILTRNLSSHPSLIILYFIAKTAVHLTSLLLE